MKKEEYRSDHGQGLIEFAIILPILLLLLMVIFDVGRSVYTYSVVHNAAREGARSGIIYPYDPNRAIAVARHLTTGLDPDPARLIITPISTTDTFEMQVSYTFTAATPYLGRLTGSPTNTITLVGRSRMAKEH